MQVNTEDVTVPWGRSPDPMDVQFGRWRMAVYQDVQESFDKTKLFFLYDPIADETSGTTLGRKGSQGLVVFDLFKRCFVREIPLNIEGIPKFMFCLKCPSPSGGTSLVVASTAERYGQNALLLWRVNVTSDGMNLEREPLPLLSNQILINDSFIISMREDAPEVVLMTGPGMTIWRINCLVEQPSPATETFSVANADLSHFYDAYLSQGNIYFLSASPDGHFDHSRIHVVDLTGSHQLRTQMCSPDQMRGNPPARKQAAMDSMAGFILLAGGEIDYGNSVNRLVDYWVLNLTTFTWHQCPSQMPIPLIEPRLTVTNSGNVYLWGDFDQPLPGMPTGTHLRILKISGFEDMKPPSYAEALHKPTTPPYPSQFQAYTSTSQPPYPSPGYSQTGAPPPTQPSYQPMSGSYPATYGQSPAPYPQGSLPYNQGQYPQTPSDYSQNTVPPYPQGTVPQQQPYGNEAYSQQTGQHAYYPPQENKNCSLQ